MEFRYRAGEEKERVSASMDPLIDSSSSSTSSTISSYSYFTRQAILAGIDIGNLGNDRPNVTKESLLEEIKKKRLREEMLAKEIACKRMLEEEILRQLENESKFENKDAWSGSECERSSFVNQMTNNGFTEIKFMDELKKSESVNAEPANFSKSEMPRISLDRKFPASKLPGVKRKASGGLSDSTKKEWSCALCHVTTSSENNLNVHTNGKKHKAKEARLVTNDTASSRKSKALHTFDKVYCNSSPIHQCWRNHKAELEANTSVSAEAVTKEIIEDQDIVEANEESLAKNKFLTEDQDNVEANEENIGKNNG